MISNAVFPCIFTDGARVIGELSYTLTTPVYTDAMLLQELAEEDMTSVRRLEKILFTPCGSSDRRTRRKERLIHRIGKRLDDLQYDHEDRIYYGMLSSLLGSENLTNRILIVDDKDCRLQRGMRQENLSWERAEKAVSLHDYKAACWTRFLFDREPYDPDLYDTVIRYKCRELLDVIAYVFMLNEDRFSCTGASCRL